MMLYRSLILFLMCYMRLATFFSIEIVSGLQRTLITVFGMNAKRYNSLFSAYTWPDVVMSTVGAFVIDRFIGKRVALLLAATALVLGMLIFIGGVLVDHYLILLVGRFTMGLGTGTSINVENAILSIWFHDKVTFAMALLFSSGRLGAALGLLIPHKLYEYVNSDLAPRLSSIQQLALAFSVSLLLMLGLFAASVCVVVLDAKRTIHQHSSDLPADANRLSRTKIRLKDFKEFSPKFWIAAVACNIFYGIFFVFVANGQSYIVSRFGFSTNEANIANFLTFAAPVLVTPFLGFIVQSIGYNVSWGILGALLGLLAYILFSITDEQTEFMPYILCILLAFSYSFFGISIFPLPSFVVKEHLLTIAYSLFNVMYSIVLSIISVVSGTIIDISGYMWFVIFAFFLVYTVLGLLITLVVIDSLSDTKKVNKPGRWISSKTPEQQSLLLSEDY